MSRWVDEYEKNVFWDTWASLKNVVNDTELESNNSDSAIKEIARLKKVITYINDTLQQIDPELVPQAFINNLNQYSSNCLSETTSFKGTQNSTHLKNANIAIDSMITTISQTPFILTSQQKGALTSSAKAYSHTLDLHLEKLNSFMEVELGSVKSDLSKLSKDISLNLKEIESLNNQLKTVDQTIQKQSATFNTQFQTSEISRSEKFNQIEEKLQTKTETEIEKLQTKTDEIFKDLAIKSGAVLEVLGKYNDDAAKVFGVVVNTLQAGAYSSYANEEKRNANLLRWFAISLMLIGVLILIAPEVSRFIHNLSGYTLDWRSTLGRAPFSLILFVPAFYLARESTKHRNTEILNRRRELILSTIDPYLALLNDDKAQEIKLEIAKGIFSDTNLTDDSKSSSGEASNILSQVANLIKQMR
jgi:uncharacterized protein YoxC